MTSAEPPASPDPAPLASPAVWIATVAGVARHTASLNLPPRHCPPSPRTPTGSPVRLTDSKPAREDTP